TARSSDSPRPGTATRSLLPLADLRDLPVALGRDALPVAPILLLQLLQGLGLGGARALRAVHDLALREAGLCDLPRFRDGGFLIVGQRVIDDSLLLILL